MSFFYDILNKLELYNNKSDLTNDDSDPDYPDYNPDKRQYLSSSYDDESKKRN